MQSGVTNLLHNAPALSIVYTLIRFITATPIDGLALLNSYPQRTRHWVMAFARGVCASRLQHYALLIQSAGLPVTPCVAHAIRRIAGYLVRGVQRLAAGLSGFRTAARRQTLRRVVFAGAGRLWKIGDSERRAS